MNNEEQIEREVESDSEMDAWSDKEKQGIYHTHLGSAPGKTCTHHQRLNDD